MVMNCLLYGNINHDGAVEAAQINSSAQYDPDVIHSDIQDLGYYAGNFNIDIDPLFVNESSDDFRLLYLSQLLNNGDASDLPNDTYDIDDDSNTSELVPDRSMNDRQVNSTDCIDISAFEEQTEGSCEGDVSNSTASGPDGTVDSEDSKLVYNSWGTPGGVADLHPSPCGDGDVDMDDYLVIINNWGSCGSFAGSQLTIEQVIAMLYEDLANYPEYETAITTIMAHILEYGL